MMGKKILFFVIVILILSVSVVAQTSNEKTQYEKKVYEISLKYYAKISYNKEVKNLTKDELTWLNIDLKLYIIDCQFSNRINCLQNCLKFGDYSRIHGIEEGKKLWLNYKKEMKDALKLRTAQEKKNDLMDSEMGTVLRGIKKSFDSWAKKREFEKETERDRRVQQYSRQVFQDLCYEEMSKSISNYLSRLHFDFGEYDSEKEQFEIKTGSLILYLPFPIQRAKAFKDSMELLLIIV